MARRRTAVLAVAIILVVALAGTVTQFEQRGRIRDALAKTPQNEAAADRPITSLRDLNNAFVELSAAANPAVVTVFTERVLRVRQSPYVFDFFGEFFQHPRQQQPPEREYRQQGLGSGVIVSHDGYIITNNHVIAEADTINVRLIDGKTLPATVVGADEKTDIAVLRVEAGDLPSIPIGDSDQLRVGEMVLAIGSPLSPNLAHSVTSGIVSAKGRSNVGLADYEDFIQTDAAINPGNSGGALINLDGELVGINTAIASRSGGYQGIGFAVPSNMARRVMESLIEHGTVVRGWLGIYIQDIDETLAAAMDLDRSEGALVADVTEGGPADDAGIERGDIIVALGGQTVHSATQLRNEVAARQPGSTARLDILRDGKSEHVTVTLDALPTEEVARDVGVRLEEQFGFTVVPFDAELAAKYRLDRSLDGVVITSIAKSGPADRAGLREGDLIVEINRSPTKDLEEFNERVRNLKKGSTLLLRVIRTNRSFYVGFKL